MTARAVDMSWFVAARFGLFIHWGLYALPARHEWVKSREQLSDEHYRRYFDHFDPDLYDPSDWARSARRAGMRYAVLTTKHHDGFCLWDSRLTDYKVTNTPHGRDVVAAYVDAFRSEGLRVGFYHSLIDWHHPQFTIDHFHPRRDDPRSRADHRNMAEYADYLHGQVRELLTGYGKVDYLFFDFTYHHSEPERKGPEDWRSDELLRLVRELQPDVLVNDRLGVPGDFVTPEQYQPSAPLTRGSAPVAWEACQTLTGSWGYDRDNLDYKSPDLLVRMLVDGVSKGGNMLLNVGPTGRGTFGPRAEAILAAIGEWMDLHGRSVYGCTASTYRPPPDCRYTQRGDRLYLHLLAWPFGQVHLPGLAGRVRYAQLLHDASEIPMEVIAADAEPSMVHAGGQGAGVLTIELPVQRPDVLVPVVELFLTEA
jgi:alpha-L-fucosidase